MIEKAIIAHKLYQGKLGNKESISFSLRLLMDDDVCFRAKLMATKK